MKDRQLRILFVCTGNSARSIMAEAIANQKFTKHADARSAGSKPTGELHPHAVTVIERNGLSTEGLRSKSLNEFCNHAFDLVLTLCDNARQEPCPVFPGSPVQAHWPVPDPAAGGAESLFEGVFDALDEAIGLLVFAPNPSVKARAAEAARELSRRFSPKAL